MQASYLRLELEEKEVSCQPYLLSGKSASSLVGETPPLIYRREQPDRGRRPWNEEEIGRIRAVFKKITSLRIQNDQDAEDLVQEALLTMISKFPEQGPEKGLLIWGMGVLRRKVGNYYRKTQRYLPIESENSLTMILGRAGRKDRPAEAEFEHRELQGLVEQIMEGFPQPVRNVLELHLAGWSASEIARSLRPERYQNVVNRLYRGRKRLARQLKKHGYC